MSIFYRPHDGFVGDVVPFYWQSQYHAFYLKAPLPPARQSAAGTPYAHLVSTDLTRWDEWPLAVEPGRPGDPDAQGCWTGCVIEHEGVFHMFYTGYAGSDQPQTVCHAVSSDLRMWQKDPHNPLLRADTRWYEAQDWRDPFVFWNEDAGEYWMLLAARQQDGPSHRKGCIALAASSDLEHWQVRPPFWAPRLWYTHECPDLFRWGDAWVLVFSTFSERRVTHYRMSRSLRGPWRASAHDVFDGRAFYAAKTAGDGQRRFVFGWNPTRAGETDAGAWEWGGDLLVHELTTAPGGDGVVSVPVPAILGRLSQPVPLELQPVFGEWTSGSCADTVRAPDSCGVALLGRMPDPCRLELTLSLAPGTRAAGVLFCAADSLESYYELRWEPGRRRIVYDRRPRPGDEPFSLESSLDLAPDKELHLTILMENSTVVTYAGGHVSLSHRLYDHPAGQLGLFVQEGEASFMHVGAYTIAPAQAIGE